MESKKENAMAQQQQISAEQAVKLVYNLFMNNHWLLEPGMMMEADGGYEEEALQALLSLNGDTRWQNVSLPAARVASSLLAEFLALLTAPKNVAWASRRFSIDPSQTEEQQAFSIIAAEILRNHPRLRRIQ